MKRSKRKLTFLQWIRQFSDDDEMIRFADRTSFLGGRWTLNRALREFNDIYPERVQKAWTAYQVFLWNELK